MNVTRKLVTSLLLLAVLFTQACTKKKPPLPPHAQAPTLAVNLPEAIPEPETTELTRTDQKQPPPEPPAPNKKTSKKPAKAPAKKATAPATTTVAATPPAASAPEQTQSQNAQTVASLHPHNNPEPTPEMTVAAAIPSDRAKQQKDDTAHMVEATETKLKGINRQLNDEEKSMRTQIETYLQQSRKATADGDYERAYNLAKKAEVLADALTKP